MVIRGALEQIEQGFEVQLKYYCLYGDASGANCFCDMLNVNLISINPSSIIKSDPENSNTNLPSVIKPDPLAALAPKRTLGALLSTLPESQRSSTRIPRLGLKSIGGGGGGY